MIGSLSRRVGRRLRRRVAKRLWILAVVGALAIAAVLPQAARAQGQVFQYTYPPGSPCATIADLIDPINVVFVGAPDWETVDPHFPEHLFWGSVDSGSPQDALDSTYTCRGVARQIATAGSDSSDRLHARLFEYGYGYEPGGGDGWHIHVAAHHDLTVQDASGDDCHAVPPNGFNETRNLIVNGFTDGYPFGEAHRYIKLADWGNRRPKMQCNGELAASDGLVAFLDAYGASAP